jgi:regulator of protease activity HflC (stomatin/prohibitin superfamily)
LICGGCCLFITVISVILLGTSFAVLKPTQVGIRFNPLTNKMQYDDGIYGHGRHLLAPGHSFKSYSLKLRTLSWGRFACWSKDKQEIIFEPLAIMMRIKSDKVIEIYNKFGGGKNAIPETTGPWEYWKDLVTMTVRGATRAFDTEAFFNDRESIEQALTNAVKAALANEHVTDISVHFGAVQIPYSLKQALLDKVVMQQNELTATKQREIVKVEAGTYVVKQAGESQITMINARAEAEAKKITQFAYADANRKAQSAYATGYKDITSQLGFTADQLLQYIWARSVSSASSNKELIVALDGTTLNAA